MLPPPPDHLLMLLQGADRPRTQAQLAHLMYGVPVKPVGNAEIDQERASAIRAVQEACEELRRRSVALCSSGQGMWVARSAEEALDTYRRNRARAIRQLVNNRHLLKAARRMGDVQQTDLGLVA
jgi:alkanesulfonate monooxygenase SsuD/methylene tetrahydromethanopterin reductase-like flavin-dependent oxidoreductase (luciferase family)